MRLKRGVERESCDFCHGRKIKCDRAPRAARGIDGCSACERRDLACLVDDSGDVRLQRRRRLDSRLLTEFLLDLNAESAFFLDQIFMGNLASEWTTTNDTYTGGLAMDDPLAVPTSSDVPSDDDLAHYQDLWRDCALPSADLFRQAVQAYFDHAAMALPITFEDAFWRDVRAKAASPAFLCAVACRGMPFTRHPEQWPLQRRLAHHFKDLFLQRQQSSSAPPSLDDVEALALMVDFPYGEVSGLERLFLSKKSLVLVTLEMGSTTTTPLLSRAPERHSLLFWHVYGLDAFSCLDAKTPSRIPEAEAARPQLTQHAGFGYLDAMLSLALVARAILQTLSGSSHRGITHADVDALYTQLEHWRAVSCPPHLRSWRRDDGESAHLDVQRAVLHLLRVNCYLQIENWVDEHGLSVASVADLATGARVEYESLRAVQDGADVAAWLGEDRHVGDFAVVDLAPNILRDISAGLGVWTCLHGVRQVDNSTYQVHDRSTKGLLEMHLETARLFRSTVAAATSHSDTPR
ncbi:Fungal transcriptional regulatory protein [Cordyceps fumosorosea ARSEF 2679]|uniref:Fungal transcriptional regulatory protein n=1 Tax=Cordyceps fumosorosea (strain ARSEF 2679) TaxID=1081104 RepID=A0A167QML5_CORFA|nr:Fungal transcriptional regulatory protein [Cordyceps fumosorosea ARSEF 2679]OAA57778.1 Fungal transcriptional regulatory protein [Cordyceps fumosorosea ARSEF 2679]